MPKLSVNINKIATIRNSRGGNNPDLIKVALDAEQFGAEGITVHPRPDERHIRYDDVRALKKVLLPAPLAPRSPIRSPGPRRRVTSDNSCKPSIE